ncbi:MAG: hotdog fold thioesterase [Oleiphilaceae bacterium]|nr:hotdog fold thioesterase [Oleiphilaceae bacterium]
MPIWKQAASLEQLNQWNQNTINAHLGITFTELGDDYVAGTMPVDTRTRQPMGILHGGASVVLAESLGSIAAHLAAEPGQRCVGLDINANHIRSVSSGEVRGVARALHIGSSTQVWEIHIHSSQQKLVCIARLTIAVLNPKSNK